LQAELDAEMDDYWLGSDKGKDKLDAGGLLCCNDAFCGGAVICCMLTCWLGSNKGKDKLDAGGWQTWCLCCKACCKAWYTAAFLD
jgi:hypothetical protein